MATFRLSSTRGRGGVMSYGDWVNQQLKTAGVAHTSAYSDYVQNYQAEQERSLKRSAQSQAKQLMGEYQTAYDEAKKANLERYQQILAGYGTRYGTAMTDLGQSRTAVTGQLASNRAEVLGGLEGLGKEELAGIGRQYTRERASASQGLISSGLYSTTVAPAVLGGVGRREGYAVGAAQERLRREKLGYISQLGAQELQALKEMNAQELMTKTGLKKEELDFMERREDEYPSESLYVQLMKGLGSS